MYEQNDVPVFRRIIWLALWFVVTVAVLWVLIWLVFFHHSSKKTAAPLKEPAQHSQSTPAPRQTTSTPAPSASAAPGPAASTQSGSNATATPTQLANTGAGNIVVPFTVSAVLGSTFYYIRTRKKLVE